MNSDSLKGLPVDNGFEDKVFENELENEKSALIKEVKKLGDIRDC